jgi:hypothetical protein
MAEKQKIRIRPVEEKDIDRLPEFLSEGFPNDSKELWKSRFSMWWKENPAMNSSIPGGWVLEKDGKEIVGFLGNIPVKYQINGKTGKAVASSSWYVRPEFQGIWSVKLMYAFLKQADADLFLNTTPMENVEKMMKQFGFSPLKLPFNGMEYWYVLDYDNIFDLITYKLSRSRKILLPLLKIISFKLKILSYLKRRYKKNPRPLPRQQDYECSLCTHCDDSFTELWEKNRDKNTTTLYREAVTLNWLYFSNAVRKKRYVIQCVHKPTKKLVGYFAYDLNDYRDLNVRVLKLKDAYVPKNNNQIISSFLLFSADLANDLSASGIRLWAANQTMGKILKKKIKIRRKFSLPFYYKLEKNLEMEIKNNKNHEFIPSPIDPNRGTL